MINLVAFITAIEGRRADVLALMRENLAAVRAERGCIEYRPTVDLEKASRVQTLAGDDTIVVIEKWEDRDALRAHMNAPHMIAYADASKNLITQRAVYFLGDVDASR